ncbi:4a-hydroxytetrahydrobiopterin dehydratase [Chloroflexus sp.]|uniref:4a-hydroxytetrahydrobiopterin dehydratase n=1 Tax=Chloroflexus sp. TaxID=1904827 RepID=UPI002ADD33B1|nr:4a-hydroxytetrahydrobiopterin dehydratase [Chloroflexus sp.]
MPRLSEAEIAEQLAQRPDWSLKNNEIVRTFRLANFPAAIAFVTHVAFLAEAAGHHPDIDIRYNRVRLALTTHDAGGLTEKDFALAAAIDEILG